MKQVALTLIAIYVAVAELPFVFHLLGYLLPVVTHPTAPPDSEALGNLLAAAITGLVVPWWLDPLVFLSAAPLLAVGFLVGVWWLGKLDG